MNLLKVGITGGMGSGKSTVAKIIQLLGYPVYNSEIQARSLMNSDNQLMSEISAIFGDNIYDTTGLNRKEIARRVFTNSNLLKKLEAVVHPAVEKHFNNWCENQNSQIVFKEAAILFETGAYKMLDTVICVTAPEDVRIKRIMNRDGLTQGEVMNRLKFQWDDEKKLALSEFAIYANDNHSVIKQVITIVDILKKRI
jgi:dephospho-CoA kinase